MILDNTDECSLLDYLWYFYQVQQDAIATTNPMDSLK